VGADGLHSGVRRLAFGSDAGHSTFLGPYLAVVSLPKSLARTGDVESVHGVNRVAMIYSADHLDDARALFLFRPPAPLQYDHRDEARQRMLLRQALTGLAPVVDSWLDAAADSNAFYFDSITQLELSSWSQGRVTLVGDAGYCPGPAIGGSTSLAVFGAYVLAGELSRFRDDYALAFAAYEQVMADPVIKSRALARGAAKTMVPSSAMGVRGLIGAAQLISLLPTGLTRIVAKLNDNGIRMYDSLQVPDYAAAPS
jgi:2-polyprenyl-6-methoxyphenol hydroxylase-like FAD-dependent oxidoreductase